MKQTVLISYDLDLRGDYKALYAWLDAKKARECGDSVAILQYEHSGDLREAIKSDLAQAVPDIANARIYMMHRDPETNLVKGGFLFGQRMRPPWSGYAPDKNEPLEDELAIG